MKARRVRRLLLGALALAAVVALAVFGLASDRSAATGRPAPALPRESLVGRPFTLAGLLKSAGSKGALVVFWASWCGPCAREAPAVERFSRSPAGRGRIVGVDWSDGRSDARAFVKRYGWTFPNLRDGEGLVGNDYRLTVLPSTFVIDASGRIRTVLRGPQSEASLTRALASDGRTSPLRTIAGAHASKTA
ncbi:MAG TPA: TlpA disulfide reductase family protein [Solirubrobacteraceae bacterium]|jgi:thiol-disulfide isomerase/thioredoxin